MSLDQIGAGVEKLLAFVTDRAAVESRRPPTLPDGLHIRTLDVEQFPDGVTFQLRIISHPMPRTTATDIGAEIWPNRSPTDGTNDLGIHMIWHDAPTDLTETSEPWMLWVDVCEDYYPWVPRGTAEFRKIRSILDAYARPRLILPKKHIAEFREECVALIALFAAKERCLAPRDEHLPQFFRSYCARFFSRQRRNQLSEADWHGIVDRVFERLFSGQVGMGFTMPPRPLSFRAYVSKAIRGQVASARGWRRPIRKQDRFPSSIDAAAHHIGVSHMTVRRWVRRLHFREWSEEAWLAVSSRVAPKKQWQKVDAKLRGLGLRADAARKRVQRWRNRGLTPSEALRLASPAKPARGTCTACGLVNAAGGLLNGKFFCGECLAEKLGHSPGTELLQPED